MQNKTASALIITGTIASLISTLLNVIMPGSNYQVPFSVFTAVYIGNEILFVAALLFFAVFYLRYGLGRMKTPGILLIVSGVASAVYFCAYEYYLNSLASYQEWYVVFAQRIPWLGVIVSTIMLGAQLLRTAPRRKTLSWLMLLTGGFMLLQSAFSPYQLVFTLLSDSQYIETWRKLANFLAVAALCTPVGLLFVAEKLSAAETEDADGVDGNSEVLLTGSSDAHDLLDSAYEQSATKPAERKTDHNSVVWWLVTFFISSVPIAGFCFCVYWSIAKSQVRRGNWAVANIIVSMISVLLLFLYATSNIRGVQVSSSITGAVIIGIIVFFGSVATIAGIYNNRNQENISLDNYLYSPTVSGWIGYSVLMGIPIVNLVCLIVFATDAKDKYRQTWAQGRLLLIPFSIVFAFSFYTAIVSLRTFL